MPENTKELRHAARRLVRSPAFSVAAVLTLALGVAANSTIFTVVNRVILRPDGPLKQELADVRGVRLVLETGGAR